MKKTLFIFLFVFGSANISLTQPLELTLRGPSGEMILKMGSVDCVAYSPDGQTIATCGPLGVFFWDVETYELNRWFAKDSGGVKSAAFSPDGRRFLTGGEYSKLWDVESGEEIRTYLHTGDAYSDVAFSPDGKMVLTENKPSLKASELCSWDVWDSESGEWLQTFITNYYMTTAAFSPDGSRVLIGGEILSESRRTFFGVATLWDIESGKEIQTFKLGENEMVQSVAFSPDSKRILTGISYSGAVLWDAESGELIRRFAYQGDAVAFSPDGSQVLIGGNDCSVWLLNAETGSTIHKFLPSGGVKSAAFSPDGKRILTGSWDGPAMIWDAESGEEIHTFHYTGGIQNDALMFSPNGERVLTGSRKVGTLWNAKSGAYIRSFGGRPAAFTPEGDCVLTDGGHQTDGAKLWDTETGALIQTFHHGPPVGISLDGKRILTEKFFENVKLWDVETAQVIQTFNAVIKVLFSPNGKRVLALNCPDDTCGEATLWDAETGSLIQTFSGHTASAAFSPDGERFLTVNKKGAMLLWDAETGQVLLTTYESIDFEKPYSLSSTPIVFSPDGSQVLTGGEESAQLWDAKSGEEIDAFSGYTSPVAFSPDGKYIAIGNENGFVELWDVETMKWLRTIVIDFERLKSVAISPDGGSVLTEGDSVRIWDISDLVGNTDVNNFMLHQ